MATITAKFIAEKQTPGAVKFVEVSNTGQAFSAPNSPGCKIGSLYIRKTAFQEASARIPTELTVTIDIT
jgi:hypothetical protein